MERIQARRQSIVFATMKGKVMKRKHQPYRRNDGFWSCGVCKWHWDTRPSHNDCPGILRIAHATEEYKTAAQWRKLGCEPYHLDDADATSHGHSSKWHYYYHSDHVRHITQHALDGAYCTCLYPGQLVDGICLNCHLPYFPTARTGEAADAQRR